MHPLMRQYLDHLVAQDRGRTAEGYALGLANWCTFCAARGCDPMAAATADLLAFQRFLAEEYRSPADRPLARTTQATRLVACKAFYQWCERQEHLLVDIAEPVQLPRIPKRPVRHDHLALQEVVALLETQAGAVAHQRAGTYRRAQAMRDLALIATAIASGQRRAGLLALRIRDIDCDRREIRWTHQKGKPGSVLPVATWCAELLRTYLVRARPVLDARWTANDRCFVGERRPDYPPESFARLLRNLHRATCREHPDLDELPAKRLTPHGLRVTCAHLLFQGGCHLRSLNELLMHDQLETTARYTPVDAHDLHRIAVAAHPRT